MGAFLLFFSLALVYTAGLLLAGAHKKVDQERCYQLASSFAGEMDRELKTEDSGFQKFADKFLESRAYSEYDPENPSTVYHYIAESNAGEAYGKIKLRLHKELNEQSEDTGTEILSGSLPQVAGNADFTDLVNTYKNKTFHRYVFTVEVIAESGDLSYNYATEYFREDKYKVTFSHKGTAIVWDGVSWKVGNTAGIVYEGWKNSQEPIQYEYHVDELESGVYRNVHAEKAMETGAGG